MKNILVLFLITYSMTIFARNEKALNNSELKALTQAMLDSDDAAYSSSSLKGSTVVLIKNNNVETALANTIDIFSNRSFDNFLSHRRTGVAQTYYKKIKLVEGREMVECKADIGVVHSLKAASIYIHACEINGKSYDRTITLSNVYLPEML